MNWIQNAIFKEDMMMFTPSSRFIFTLIVNLQSKMLLNQCQDLSLQIPSRLKKFFGGVLENSRTSPLEISRTLPVILCLLENSRTPAGKFQDPTGDKVMDISKHHPFIFHNLFFNYVERTYSETIHRSYLTPEQLKLFI